LDGILNINKPLGKTSFGVVASVKRLTGERRAGHAGTLDPDATGILPVCLGQGTRIVEFLMDTTKTYRAKIELGKATDTYDSSGKVIRQANISDININKVEQALEHFRGDIQQTPPMYSAIKHQGKPLYKFARAGIAVQQKSRKVTIHRLELISWESPVLNIEIECSKGTYIRSLAHDLGEVLGCGAYLKDLVRTRYGIFDIDDAVSLPQLAESVKHGDWQQYLYPIDSVLEDFSKIVINEVGEQAIKTGRLISPENIESQDINKKSHHRYYRAYSTDGRFIGMLQPVPDKEAWQPKKVFV
jgi:tRNA pseudouridine55 synthase